MFPRTKVGMIAQVKGGKRLPLDEELVTYKTDHPYIRARDIRNGQITFDDPVYITERVFDKIKRYTVNAGNVCVVIVGANVGDVGAVPQSLDGANLTENAAKLVNLSDDFDPVFLKFCLLSDGPQKQMKLFAGGAAQPKLGLYKIEEIDMPCPPLPIQRRIASILSAYDDLIENNTRRIKILEQMAQAIYHEWFVEFRAPGVKLRKATPEEKKATGKDRFPVGWELRTYADLLENYSGGDWGSEEPDEKENCPVVIIRGTDFSDVRTGGALRAPTRYIAESSLEKRGLRTGDILVENSVNASSRCVGTSLLITDGVLRRIGADVICASFCKNFRPKQPELAPLLHLHMKHLYDSDDMAFYQHVATNGIGNFQAQRFVESAVLALPTDATTLGKMLVTLRDLTATTYAGQVANLRQTRDLLLPRLVSGEVDVENIVVEV